MRILVFRVHKINIGEAIVTKGAIACIQKAFPDAEITEITLYPDKIQRRIQRDSLSANIRTVIGLKNTYDDGKHARIVDLIDADLAIIPGGILRSGIEQFMKTFQTLRLNETPIILLGAGGNGSDDFSNPEFKKRIQSVFEELDINHLITRNPRAFEAFKEDIRYIHNGIDCGFFINDWYQPPSASTEFATATFDHKDRSVESEYELLFPHHVPFNRPHWSIHKRLYYRLHPLKQNYNKANIRKNMEDRKGTFISDNIKEYLFLYSNTNVTHSDRIHAIIPTLSYGNPAQLYTNDLRRYIFDDIVDGNIIEEPVSVLEMELQQKKKRQLQVLQEFVNTL